VLGTLKHQSDEDDEKRVGDSDVKVNLDASDKQQPKGKRLGNTTPVDYLYAKRKLKKAMAEHYRSALV
jgi:hypothetical protein